MTLKSLCLGDFCHFGDFLYAKSFLSGEKCLIHVTGFEAYGFYIDNDLCLLCSGLLGGCLLLSGCLSGLSSGLCCCFFFCHNIYKRK